MTSKFFFTATFAVLLSALFASNIINFTSDYNNLDNSGGFEAFPIVGAFGPESFAFDNNGEGPYTGISDGRIIKWQQNQRRWINFAVTSPHSNNRFGREGARDHEKREHICGRPLGLKFDKKNGDLYIADAYLGLLVVGPEGGLANRIVTHVQGVSFGFTNSLDIDQTTGVVYFTDSSTRFHRRDHIALILSGDKTGRLMKYDPKSKQVEVVLQNLSFPNGVALSENGDFLILAETSNCRILRYWLKTPKAGALEVFAQLIGFPDNIKRSPRRGFWVGIYSKKEKVLGWILSKPKIGRFLVKLIPNNIFKGYAYLSKLRGSGIVLRLSEEGDVLDLLEDKSGCKWKDVSDVEEKDGILWIGSVNSPFVGKYII